MLVYPHTDKHLQVIKYNQRKILKIDFTQVLVSININMIARNTGEGDGSEFRFPNTHVNSIGVW